MQLNRSFFAQVRRTGGLLHRAFSEVSNQAATVSPPATKTPRGTSPRRHIGQNKSLDNDIVYLNGLSRFSSRKDLTLFLGPHKPIMVDPVLTIHHNFTGVYGLKFATAQELTAFQKFVNTMPKRVGMQNFSVLQAKWFDDRRSVAASTRRVTNRTVRCQLIDKPHTYTERLAQFFENYNLQQENIDRVSYGDSSYGPVTSGSGQTSHYLLHFESHEEAVRAVVENQHKTMFGSEMKLELYLC